MKSIDALQVAVYVRYLKQYIYIYCSCDVQW